MGSPDEDKNRRGVLAENYLENARDITASIDNIERSLIASNARRILKMFNTFRDMAVKYGLIHNEVFTEAFKNFNFVEMERLVEKVTFANEILTEYIDVITTWSESETSDTDEDS